MKRLGNGDFSEPEPVEIPINGILDLHAFQPHEAADLILNYLEECRKRNILQVRIIHGKGKGILRGRVHSVLARAENVETFHLAGDAGGWGATIVVLRPIE
jgi:DNA-nicking Smr family endonuclease